MCQTSFHSLGQRLTPRLVGVALPVNWNLDPCLLGERSEGCRGSAAIVSLLSRLSVASSASKGTQRQGGEIAPGDTDFGEGDRGDGDTKTDSTAAGTSQKPVKVSFNAIQSAIFRGSVQLNLA